jgi:FtsP/CotA-like multicopper oxidase with cupredoxin domain
VDRRGFLATGAALALAPRATRAQRGARKLRIAPARQSLVGAANPATDVWAYDGAVPGPELRFREGERLRVEVENALSVGTTIHWHGIRVPNAMDGVPHVTQPPIAANGGRFTYDFSLPDAGTYWYHPHLSSPEQVARGLYGALVVEERDPPAVDRDLVWVLSDWRLDREARLVEGFANPMDSSHAGRIGNTVTVNGAIRDRFAVRAGERIRLRLVNASNARIYGLEFEGHAPMVIALDGQAVAPHREGRVVLGPGMRADLILDCSASPGSEHRVIDTFYRQRAYRLTTIAYGAERPLREAFDAVPSLPRNRLALPDVANAERHRIVFGGGMMGAMPSQREHRGLFWTVNGKVMPEHAEHDVLATLRRGASYVLELVNETAWHHPIHLHGHFFRVLPAGHWLDTVLLDPDSRVEVALVADNPGDWMLHCHVLEHQATGMMALVRVA